MIFTFTKVQTSVKRTGMIDVIYFEGTLSMRKGAPGRLCLPPKLHLLATPLLGAYVRHSNLKEFIKWFTNKLKHLGCKTSHS